MKTNFLPIALTAVLLNACGVLDFSGTPSVNGRPVALAEAAGGALVFGGQQVRLDGGKSNDPDGDRISYKWEQVAGIHVEIDDVSSARITFMAPEAETTLVFALTVNDGTESSLRTLIEIRVQFNRAPVAEPGPTRAINNLQSLTLDATGSDPDGDAITGYWWSVDSTPSGATYALSATDTLSPNFKPEGKGIYAMGLRVSDGKAWSQKSTLLVDSLNNAPLLTVNFPVVVTANAQPAVVSATPTDPDGDVLDPVQWGVSDQPSGGFYTLLPSGNSATLTPFGKGAYRLSATVSDGEAASNAAEATVLAQNVRPVAAIVPSTAVLNNATSYLNSDARDDDGDTLTYAWTLVNLPLGANASLASGSAAASFIPHGVGSYVVSLQVNDGALTSLPATTTVVVANTPPVANAGLPLSIVNGSAATLQGAGSDADGDGLAAYAWAVESYPIGATWQVTGGGTVSPSFRPQGKGVYTLSLRVSDGLAWSGKAYTTLSALNASPVFTPAFPAVQTGNTLPVLLSGTPADPDGDAITEVEWSVLSAPQGAAPSLFATGNQATFRSGGRGGYSVGVRAADADGWGAWAVINVVATNSTPTMTLAPVENMVNFASVYLNATAVDLDGDTLNYAWRLVSKPLGASAVLQSGIASPLFQPSGHGVYVIEAKVSDAFTESSPVTTAVRVLNTKPVADAGTSQAIANKTAKDLTGSGSDADGDAITAYQWAIESSPAGSTPVLTSAASAFASFTPQGKGLYTVSLQVMDGLDWSNKGFVQFTAANSAPSVTATTDLNYTNNGSAINLRMYAADPDGDAVTRYTWTVDQQPQNATFDLVGASNAIVSFTPHGRGTYRLVAQAGDADALSAPLYIYVVARNVAPLAVISPASPIPNNGSAYLDGSSSSDPDGDVITYSWSVIARPVDSIYLLQNGSASPLFTPQARGIYTLQLITSDGALQSTPATINVEVLNGAPTAHAGGPYTGITAGMPIFVSAEDSTDPDGDALTFTWRLLPDAALYPGQDIYLTAPLDKGTYSLRVNASDGQLTSSSTVQVVVDNTRPVAVAVATQSVPAGAVATLDGSGSYDLEGNSLTYEWVQTGGPPASLSNVVTAKPTFVVDGSATEYAFKVRVNDGRVWSAAYATTLVSVAPGNATAVFVSGLFSNSDANPGTQESPVRTIQQGIALAITTNPAKKVIVAGGGATSYLGIIQINNALELLGGYDPTTWIRNVQANPTIVSNSGSGNCQTLLLVNTPLAVVIDGFTFEGMPPPDNPMFTCGDPANSPGIFISLMNGTTLRNSKVNGAADVSGALGAYESIIESTEITLGESVKGFRTGVAGVGFTVKNSTIYLNAGGNFPYTAFYAYSAEQYVIEGNTIINNSVSASYENFGFYIDLNSGGVTDKLDFVNNLCVDLANTGNFKCMYTDDLDNVRTVNNTFIGNPLKSSNADYKAVRSWWSTWTLQNNYFEGWNDMGFDTIHYPDSFGGNVFVNPAFTPQVNTDTFSDVPCTFANTDGTDFDLYYRLTGGACVDAGLNTGASGPIKDRDGNARYDWPAVTNISQGTGADAGWSELRP